MAQALRSGRQATLSTRLGFPKSAMADKSAISIQDSRGASKLETQGNKRMKAEAKAEKKAVPKAKKEVEVLKPGDNVNKNIMHNTAEMELRNKTETSTTYPIKLGSEQQRVQLREDESHSSSSESDSESSSEDSIGSLRRKYSSSYFDGIQCRIFVEDTTREESEWDYEVHSQGPAEDKAFILIEKAGNQSELSVTFIKRLIHPRNRRLFEFTLKANGNPLAVEVRDPDDLLDIVQKTTRTPCHSLGPRSPSKIPTQIPDAHRTTFPADPPLSDPNDAHIQQTISGLQAVAHCTFVGQDKFLEMVAKVALGHDLTSAEATRFVEHAKEFKVAREFILACGMSLRGGHDGQELVKYANRVFQATFRSYVKALEGGDLNKLETLPHVDWCPKRLLLLAPLESFLMSEVDISPAMLGLLNEETLFTPLQYRARDGKLIELRTAPNQSMFPAPESAVKKLRLVDEGRRRINSADKGTSTGCSIPSIIHFHEISDNNVEMFNSILRTTEKAKLHKTIWYPSSSTEIVALIMLLVTRLVTDHKMHPDGIVARIKRFEDRLYSDEGVSYKDYQDFLWMCRPHGEVLAMATIFRWVGMRGLDSARALTLPEVSLSSVQFMMSRVQPEVEKAWAFRSNSGDYELRQFRLKRSVALGARTSNKKEVVEDDEDVLVDDVERTIGANRID